MLRFSSRLIAYGASGSRWFSQPASKGVGALHGVRVVDLSKLLPGPFATQLMVDLGAEVIKVEPPKVGDLMRAYPPKTTDGNGLAFHALNRGKKSVCLNLKEETDKQRLMDLLTTADVLVETYRPRVMERLGLGFDLLQERFPKLICCSISGYGQTGPGYLRAGHDVNYLARSGVLGLLKEPTILPVQVADVAGGSWPAAFQIVSALYQRQRTGRGCYIDVSMADCAFAMSLMPQAEASNTTNSISGGKTILVGSIPCYKMYPVKDGFISVGSLEPHFWEMLCQSLERPDLISYQFAEGQRFDYAVQQLTDVFMSATRDQWRSFFAGYDCCVEVVEDSEDIWKRDPQLASRELTRQVRVRDTTLELPISPLRMSEGMAISTEPSSEIGQDNAALLEPETVNS